MCYLSSQEEEGLQPPAAASHDGRDFHSHRPGRSRPSRRKGPDRQQAGPGASRDNRAQKAAWKLRGWSPRVIVSSGVWSWDRP